MSRVREIEGIFRDSGEWANSLSIYREGDSLHSSITRNRVVCNKLVCNQVVCNRGIA